MNIICGRRGKEAQISGCGTRLMTSASSSRLRQCLHCAALTISMSASLVDASGLLSRADWGAPAVTVSHNAATWTISGLKHTATLDGKTLTLTIHTRSNTWAMAPSGPKDMLVKAGADEFPLRMTD